MLGLDYVKTLKPTYGLTMVLLSELASSRTKSQTTPTSTSCQTASDKLLLLLVLVPNLQVATSSPSTSTAQQSTQLIRGPINRNQKSKYTSEGDTTECVSLEMFNKASTDLESKGMINLKK